MRYLLFRCSLVAPSLSFLYVLLMWDFHPMQTQDVGTAIFLHIGATLLAFTVITLTVILCSEKEGFWKDSSSRIVLVMLLQTSILFFEGWQRRPLLEGLLLLCLVSWALFLGTWSKLIPDRRTSKRASDT